MDWREWIGSLGIGLHRFPDVGPIILAVVLLAGGYGIGWFVGSRIGPRLASWWRSRAGAVDSHFPPIICAVVRYAVTTLLLFVIGNLLVPGSAASGLLAAGLGIAAALLAFHLARGFGLAMAPAAMLGVLTFIAATAGVLGGMKPLFTALDSARFAVGSRNFSLLAILNFIVVGAVLFVLARIVNRLLVHSIGRVGSLDISQRTLLQKLAGIGVIIVAVLFGIDLLGIDLTALAFFSGAFGLAIGFGLQKTFGNLISGLILLMDRSVKPGDVIVVGDTFGTVNKIGVRAVSVVTRDSKEHLIPNEQLMTQPVENWSFSSPNVRLHIPVGVGHGCDLALAQRLMVEAASASPRVLKEPQPSIWLRSFGESAVEHEILVWIADPGLGIGSVQSDILNRLWVLFSENKIELPYPQRDIHIRSLPRPEDTPDSVVKPNRQT